MALIEIVFEEEQELSNDERESERGGVGSHKVNGESRSECRERCKEEV